MGYRFIIAVLSGWLLSCADQSEDKTQDAGTEDVHGTLFELRSPDASVQITVQLIDLEGDADYESGERLYYSVAIGDGTDYDTIIDDSPLGIVRSDGTFADNLTVDRVGEETMIDEPYEMITGKRRQCRNLANERALTVRNADGQSLRIDFRAYNDGAAFRYVFPETDEAEYTIQKELTGFRVPENSRAWMLPYEHPGHDQPAYEGTWLSDIEVGTTASEIIPAEQGTPADQTSVAGWALPALFRTDRDHWVLLAESDVGDSYCGVHLADEVPHNVYRVAFPSEGEAEGIGDALPTWTLPWIMPWRLVIVGDSLAPIVENTLPTDVAAPSTVTDSDWIIPGRASWHWWSYEDKPMDYNEILPFIDLAAEMSWEYSLVDANWDQMVNGTWEDVLAYAEPLNVGIFLWYNGGGDHNTWMEEPRDIMSDPEARRDAMKTISAAGVKGVKVDFFQSDKQWMMQHYLDILEDAAEYELLVNFHGSTIPRGWQRTYPHLMTAEGVKGAEFYKWQPTYAAEQPWRNTILPFTRNTVAAMDFTPVTFTNNNNPHLTTYAHELALSVVFESGVSHFADRVEGYTSLPDGPKAFLKTVPTAWDDTKFIDGEPGVWIALARQKGNRWFVAGIAGEKAGRSVSLALSFLDDGDFDIVLQADGDSDDTFSESEEVVTSNDVIDIELRPFGGFAGILTPR